MIDTALPIIDISKLDAGATSAAQLRGELLAAAHDVGFFYLTGHGIETALFEEVLAVSKEFFALPMHDKLEIENTHSPQFRGYTRVGGELANGVVDWREQIDLGPERESVDSSTGRQDYLVLEGPNLWPQQVPRFREVFTQWQAQLSAVALRLLRTLAQALGAAPDVFDAAFANNPFPVTKIVRYPGTGEESQGVGAHRDGGVLTLLFVEPGKRGLQVERDGQWVDAPTIPGTFIVNIGELLELATGGYLKATLHRVMAPVLGDDRISIPFFFNPALSSRVPTIELPDALANKATGVSNDPTGSPILEVYGDNALRYRLRAHPNVAEKYYSKLLAK